MSEEKKNMIKQTVENLKHLDEESLKIMKSNSVMKIQEDSKMKGYVVDSGYMGYIDGEYVLFADEQDYRECYDEA